VRVNFLSFEKSTLYHLFYLSALDMVSSTA